ncbi:reverse transcriptase family protein [Flavobacterium chungnamense]|uniref:RNA-directed DNA polymerase n=1 Tax=Flavobacterium chungnamense TaxID=706182 RepID=A0ABP7V5D6_9FLAO
MKPNLIRDKIHSKLEDYNKYLYGPRYDVIFRFEQEFFVSQLLSVVKISDLRILLKAQLSKISNLMNKPSYITFSIPKKRGGNRLIQSPDANLMRIQSRLNFYLQNYYHLIRPEGIHGFVINPNKKEKICNIVDNAKIHVNQKHLLNLDLKEFFPSIEAYRVKELFVSEYFKFNEDIANALALLVTYKGKLPIGAPTSPVISNFICLQLDADLITFCNENQINFSRYADDLTFSSNKEITKEMINSIFEIIKQNQFEINTKKTRLKSNNRKQTVTGLVVNEKVNVDRQTLKMVRAMLYDASKNGIAKAASKHFSFHQKDAHTHTSYFLNRLEGYINFIAQVRGKEDALVLKFKEQFKMILKLQ